MTWTWDSSLLATSALQQLRLKVGDTNTSDQLLDDAILNYNLSLYGDNVDRAAVKTIRDIIAKLSRDIDRSDLGMSATRSQKIQHYKDLLKEIQSDMLITCEGFFGGTSKSQQDTIDADDDYKGYAFNFGQDDNK